MNSANSSQATATQVKDIDAFLGKTSSALKKLEEIINATKEFPSKQNLIYNLMNLTTDVTTFSTELINYLSQDNELAQQVIEKASLHARLPRTKITAQQLQQSIHKLGYGLVHNVVQDKIAKQLVKIYFQSEDETVKTLLKKSIRLSYIAKQLAKIVGLPDTLVFFAGLYLHLGQTVLAMRDPRSTKEIRKMSAMGSDENSSALVLMGFTFGELGATMLESWDLPENLIDIVRNQANSTVKVQNRKIASLLKFAEYINNTFADKKSSPMATWDKAYEFYTLLNHEITMEGWIEEIKLLYIQVLETEYSLFKRD